MFGKIKILILLVFFLLGLFLQMEVNLFPKVTTMLVLLAVGLTIVPILTRLNSSSLKQEIVKPEWNANPFDLKRPLNFYVLLGCLLLALGAGLVSGTLIAVGGANYIGINCICFGTGILISVFISLATKKTNGDQP